MAFFHMQIEFKLKGRRRKKIQKEKGREAARFDEVAKGLTTIVPETKRIQLQPRKRSKTVFEGGRSIQKGKGNENCGQIRRGGGNPR